MINYNCGTCDHCVRKDDTHGVCYNYIRRNNPVVNLKYDECPNHTELVAFEHHLEEFHNREGYTVGKDE
jgi:hypothetical protein